MGKMKELLMKTIEEKHGNYENYIQKINEEQSKQWIHMKDHPCPNCNGRTLHKNQNMNVNCDACGQTFIEVDGSLRFE